MFFKKKCPVCGGGLSIFSLETASKKNPIQCRYCKSYLYYSFVLFFEVVWEFLMCVLGVSLCFLFFLLPWYFVLFLGVVAVIIISSIYYFAPIRVLKVNGDWLTNIATK